MASHLTIITGTNGIPASRPFNGHKAETGPAFAALLGEKPAGQGAPGTDRASGAEGAASPAEELARPVLDAADGGQADGGGESFDAIATPSGAEAEPDIAADIGPILELIEALSALEAGLQAGKQPDPELIDRIGLALEGLAGALGLDLDSLPLPENIPALLAEAEMADNGLVQALSQLLAPLADPAGPAAQPSGEALRPLRDRLAALLGALEEGAAGEEQLARLGMKPGAPPAQEIEAALKRFAALLEGPGLPEEPVLASPSLKTSEPALAGKSAQAAQLGAPDKGAAAPESPNPVADRPAPRDNKAPVREPPGAAAPPAESAAPSASAPPAQDNGALRIEAGAAPRVIQAGYQTSQQQLNLPQIAFELARQVQDGNSRFQIRLDPPELGRIDVRLDIDKSGQVHARLTVEKAETLDLMQRDQRALERALQQAGLDGAKTSLEFSLKQNPFAGQDRDSGGDGSRQNGGIGAADEAEEAPPVVNLYRASLMAGGVNIIA